MGDQQAGFDDDDGFEVVKEKPKREGQPREGQQQRRPFEGESAFGGGMPSFTRGGGNR
jgi:hypothetical protein